MRMSIRLEADVSLVRDVGVMTLLREAALVGLVNLLTMLVTEDELIGLVTLFS